MLAPLRRYLLDGLSPLDLALALGFAAVGQVELRVYDDVVYEGSAPLVASSAAGLLASLPLAWRHRAPLGALATITAALLLPAMLFDTSILFYGGFFPQLVAL